MVHEEPVKLTKSGCVGRNNKPEKCLQVPAVNGYLYAVCIAVFFFVNEYFKYKRQILIEFNTLNGCNRARRN